MKAGDVLVELDPRDYQLAVAKAEADLAAAEAAFRAASSDVPVTSSSARSGAAGGARRDRQRRRRADRGDARGRSVARQGRVSRGAARSKRRRARCAPTQDLARLAPLAAKDEIPRQQLDAATADKQAADAAVASAEAAVREATANLAGRRVAAAAGRGRRRPVAGAGARRGHRAAADRDDRGARVGRQRRRCCRRARRSNQARLNLERTVVRAPADGVVSRRTVEVGQVVQPGQAMMSITSLHDVWVTANFKETQLGAMIAGPARRGRGRRLRRPPLRGPRRVDRRRDRRDVQPAAGRQRERQLRQGRPARAGEDRARPRPRTRGRCCARACRSPRPSTCG